LYKTPALFSTSSFFPPSIYNFLVISAFWFHIINDIHLKPNLTYKEWIFIGNAQEERRGHLFLFHPHVPFFAFFLKPVQPHIT
jgi:hypothetical protein